MRDPDDPDQFLPQWDDDEDFEDDGQPSDLQENEDFERADEWYGHFGDDC